MSRIVLVEFKTDHDDTVKAVQSVIANLSKAGYVSDGLEMWSHDEKPDQQYKFIKAHAVVDVVEIELHMETIREEARDGKDEGADQGS